MTSISLTHKKDNIAARATTLRFALGIALSALSGVLFLLAFPPYGIWPLAWFGLVPSTAGTIPANAGQMVEPVTRNFRRGLARSVPGSALWHRGWPILPIPWLLDCHTELFYIKRSEVP